jgi:1-acyl-sn-glycerol-3-phosphate acyltransferase
VRILRGDDDVIRDAAAADGPFLGLLSHASWWDPLVGLLVWRQLLPDRDLRMPMDAEQLERFGFFKRLGVFGIDPDDPASLDAMRRFVLDHFATGTRPALGLTPQGRFTDPREPVRLRPGAAAIAAAAPADTAVVAIAVEYVFWQDQRPEILISATRCPRPTGPASTTGWHRAMTDAFTDATRRLAAAAIARDPESFVDLAGGRDRIHPMMDAWLRLTGRGGGISARRSPREVVS